MTMNSWDFTSKDWELCRRYIDELRLQGLSPHEPWELELETWADQQGHLPRRSTIHRLRLRFPDNC